MVAEEQHEQSIDQPWLVLLCKIISWQQHLAHVFFHCLENLPVLVNAGVGHAFE